MNKKIYPLTNEQKSIWLTEQYYQNTTVNNICGTAIIDKEINFDILKRAINLLVKNNDSFRLKFTKDNQTLKQYVEPYKEFPIEIVSLQSKEEITNLEETLVSRKFDVETDFLFDCKIFKFPNNHGGFSVNVHHLIGDSWTLGLLTKIIINNYCNLLKSSLTNAEIEYSYVKHIEEQENYLNSNKYIKDKAYWDSVFETVPVQASIPSTQKSETSRFSCTASRLNFQLEKTSVDKINDFCSLHKISPFNFFMSILAIYIYRTTNINDFVIGTPILNRSNFYDKNVTGMFVNVSPLRIQMAEHTHFLDFIGQISTRTMELLRHQKYPYQSILEDIRKKDASVPNLYNILLSYQVTHAVEESELPYTTRWIFNGNSNDDLDIQIYDLNATGNLDISYDYNTEKYTDEDIQNLHNRLMFLINQVLINADISIDTLEIVTATEKQELLVEFNQTKLDYNKQISLIEEFEKQAILTPHSPALTFKEQTLTYQELNEKANSLAHILRSKGIKNNDIVSIMTNRSIEMIVSILAVLKSGGAYLPIDPDYPTERIDYMMEDSHSALLLTQKELHQKIHFKNILDVDLENTFYEENKENLENISKPEDLSYIIYTSGSTGKPKGVMLTQKNYTNFLASMREKIEYLNGPQKYNIVSITTVSFDIFGFETFVSLACGLHLFLTDYFEQKFTSQLEDLIVKNHIDIIQTTPSIMRFHLENLKDSKSFRNLKYVMLAGEPLPYDLVQKIKNTAPKCTVFNGYGPSETTIFSTVNNVTNEKYITIGGPIHNTQIYILDKNLNLLPKHTLGEIYIAGDGVGNGYLGKPELTQNAFIHCPFSDTIMYKTGDLGLWLDNGKILCKGRVDHQVKLRGLRIELGEIENKINHFLSDRTIQSIILKKKHKNKEFLHAFIVTSEEFDIKQLENYLLENLPNYMIPTSYSFIDKFPTTPNGKIDRKILDTYEIENVEKEIILPQTDLEKKIHSMIAELIDETNFGITDNFFSLGLDSLGIISLSAKIANEFGTTFSINELYHITNIQKLASFIESKQEKIDLRKADKKDLYPVSSAQKRIYYACKSFNKPNILYNVTGGILVNSVLNVEKIKAVIHELVNLHDSLKTKFVTKDGEVFQEILEKAEIEIPVVYKENSSIQNIVNHFAKPFSLETAPLLRAQICIIDQKKTLILIDSHHIVMDGTSLTLFINNFIDLYNENTIEKPILDYVDFSELEQTYKTSKKFEQLKNIWNERIQSSNMSLLELPYDSANANIFHYAGNTISENIPSSLFEKLENIAKKLHTSPYIVFLSVFYILLYKYTNQEELIIGTPILGRNNSTFSNVIGMFVNNAVLIQKINENANISEFIESVKENVAFSFNNQPFPYDSLQELLDKNHNNIINTMFAYQNMFGNALNIGNSPAEIVIANNHVSKFDLSFEINPFLKNISVEYNTHVFHTETIKTLLKRYLFLLENSFDTEVRIKDLSLLSEAEYHKITKKFNNQSLPLEYENLVEMFYAKVKHYKKYNAVQNMTDTISYLELDLYSNALAKILKNKGIGPNDIVGVSLKRSIEQIISIWAILKLGATYMPMYTGYPNDRLQYMCENSDAKILITNETIHSNLNFEIPTIFLNNFKDLTPSDDRPNIQIDGNRIAYIIYTSGSTGKPKGVGITHKNLINFLTSFAYDYKTTCEKDNFLASTNISFDVSIWELFSPVFSGANLVLYNEEIINNIENYTRFIHDFHITALYIPPNILDDVYQILSTMQDIKINKMLVGVEAIYKKTLNNYFNLNPNMTIINGYGPTETTICATRFIYEKQDPKFDNEIVTIGNSLANDHIYILDKDLNLQPIGIPGEIYVTGFGVGAGYIHNKPETNKNYLPNTFDTLSPHMYKTGDLAKWNPDGTIKFIGRNDSQVKISGYRIELKEINHLVEEFDGIQKAITVPNKNSRSTTLITYFTEEKKIDIKELKNQLSKSLPFYMVPKFLVPLKKFPITPNGKIDYKQLPVPTIPQSNYSKPENKIQKDLCSIFERLLNQEKIGIDDDFFEMGGDSLLAIKLQVESLKNNIHITYSDIFKYRTIRNLTQNNKDTAENLVLTDYDYAKFESTLAQNKVENIQNPKVSPIGNILLVGGTGFIGSHILANFLKTEKSIAYCLIRPKGNQDPTERLRNVMQTYFGDAILEEFDKRVIVLIGDIASKNLGMDESTIIELSHSISCVINSAAIVKHYGTFSKFNAINIMGTKNAIELCKKINKKLYQISTLSISGEHLSAPPKNKITFDETDFYIQQEITNFYIYTKFEAEKLILEEIQNGLNATILRIGNITNRYSDGMFQINAEENAFVTRIKTFLNIGIIAKDFLPHLLEFTPVDLCAKAITKIISSNPDFSIFHIYNPEFISVGDIICCFEKQKFIIKEVELETFNSLIQNFAHISNDENNNLLIDLDKNKKLNLYSPVIMESNFTVEYLKRLGFTWKKIDENYVKKYIKYFKTINYFKNKEE